MRYWIRNTYSQLCVDFRRLQNDRHDICESINIKKRRVERDIENVVR